MKTLADLKRDLKELPKITMVACSFPNRLVGVEGKVNHVQSNAFTVDRPSISKNRSWMYFPKASMLKYEGDTFTIYSYGGENKPDCEFVYKIG